MLTVMHSPGARRWPRPLLQKYEKHASSFVAGHPVAASPSSHFRTNPAGVPLNPAHTLTSTDTCVASTQVSVAKRVAPFAEKHQLMVGYHGHSDVTDPDEVATPESFASVTSYSKFHGINLDVGHFTAANFDALAFVEANHARITNLHLKDRKRDQGATTPWGEGDAPLARVLQLLKEKRYDIPANIEFEYRGDPVAEVAKCLQFCKDALK